MKKLLALLVFIPIVSIGQVDSFKDIQGINSLDQFKRVMIENSYLFTEEDEGILWYGISPTKDENDEWVSGYWGGVISHQLMNGHFNFQEGLVC